MTNEQMKPNRFGRWAANRKLYRRIMDTLNSGGIVTIATYTRAAHYDRRHANMFKVTRTGVFVQRGKSWDCFADGTVMCGIRFSL